MIGLGLALVAPASAQAPAVSRPIRPLTGVRPPAPSPSDYAGIVKDSSMLVALGKALFWDTQVGAANGQACASCHFHAGADTRTVNQLSPGLNMQPQGDLTFGNAAGKTGSGAAAGPNIALSLGDFPFHKLADVTDRESAVLFDTNDVASSQGAFQGGPVTLNENNPVGQRTRCSSTPGEPFAISAGGTTLNTRKVEPRNTPTSVNTVFMFRNFWDGRANNVFNGVNPFGRRAIAADPTARVFKVEKGDAVSQALTLENMSAASQAVGPVLSSFEMTCQGKAFPDVGRRLMQQRALGSQAVAPDDSVFSKLSGIKIMPASSGGISANYRDLVHAAFQQAYWQDNHYYTVDKATGQISKGGGAANGHQIDELNFSMFFGLAIDAYERTLISDQSPFDTGTLSTDAQAGKSLFTGKAGCASCHDGPLFSAATTFQGDSSFLPIERMAMADPTPALYDNGFYNIGVRPTFEDIGVGNTDPYGNPLSFSRQFVFRPGTSSIGVDQFSLDPCHLQIPFDGANCARIPMDAPAQSQRVAVDGAFKVPSLRNVALTAPYFHNGGQKSLDEVVAFYNRGGDRRSVSGGDTSGTGALGRPVVSSSNSSVTPGMGGSNADADVKPLGLSTGQQGQIVEFLKSLTDRRVACHMAPFDHPALTVANGQVAQDKDKDGNADDVPYALRAVGTGGYQNCDKDDSLFKQLNSGELFTSAKAFEGVK
jgi:cytochrome c peroxidase